MDSKEQTDGGYIESPVVAAVAADAVRCFVRYAVRCGFVSSPPAQIGMEQAADAFLAAASATQGGQAQRAGIAYIATGRPYGSKTFDEAEELWGRITPQERESFAAAGLRLFDYIAGERAQEREDTGVRKYGDCLNAGCYLADAAEADAVVLEQKAKMAAARARERAEAAVWFEVEAFRIIHPQRARQAELAAAALRSAPPTTPASERQVSNG